MDRYLLSHTFSETRPADETEIYPISGELKLHVLSAEDHPANQLLIRMLLKTLHATCQIVDNGLEALRALQTAPKAPFYDLVLMDIHMPVMDGFEAARAIRKLPDPHAQLPILALTGEAPDAVRTQAMMSGMNDVLCKPMQVRAFRQALIHWGRGYGAQTMMDR